MKNMILYGPPGTGKTYHTVCYAVAICEGKDPKTVILEAEKDYDAVKVRYDELKKEGRIEFINFHQSYGYEEFIEGIKPRIYKSKDLAEEDSISVSKGGKTTDNDRPQELQYTIEDGIFKAFCSKASSDSNKADIEVKEDKINVDAVEIKEDAPVYCISLKNTGQNSLKTECINNNVIRIDYPNDETHSSVNLFRNTMKKGDIIVIRSPNATIEAIGVITGDYEEDFREDFHRKREVKWIVTGINEDFKKINGNAEFARGQTCHTLPNLNKRMFLELLHKYVDQNDKFYITKAIQSDPNSADITTPYVFIIDEINRGNISKIFGELITLIEETKREGEREEASVVLPYSGKPFSVPDNVYIVGTMNTADRSIALMDTALRRRFHFIEQMPDTDVLKRLKADKVSVDGKTLDVVKMLETINSRIECLYDREHTIGHAFFTGLKDDPSVAALAGIFKNKVIPLLQEYFYEDYGKIRLVLGDDGKEERYQFVKVEENQPNQIFKSQADTSDIVVTGRRYRINNDKKNDTDNAQNGTDSAFNHIESYIGIYQDIIKNLSAEKG